MDSQKNDKVLISISQVNSSPLLMAIVRKIVQCDIPLFILLCVKPDAPILSEIEKLGVKYKNLSEVTKYSLYRHLFIHLFYMISTRPTIFLASGQYATFSGIPASFLLRLKKRIFIRHHSNFHHYIKNSSAQFLDKVMNRLATKIVAVSELVKQILIEKELASPAKVVKIYNGIDLEDFYFAKHENAAPSGSGLRIGMISRLTSLKGVEYAAQAFSDFVRLSPKSSLHIIGEFSDSHYAVNRILQDAQTVNFTLQREFSNISNFLSGIDVFVHIPITDEVESFGLVYLEALAAGKICIFTISGILREFPDPEEYFHVVRHQNSTDILNAFIEIERRGNLSATIPTDWLSRFSLDLVGENYLKEFLS